MRFRAKNEIPENTGIREYVPVQESRREISIRRWLIPGSVALVALVAVIAVGFDKRETASSVAGIRPVTTFPGDEREPSLSPDGRQVAFSWEGNKGDNRDIYVALLGEQDPLRLTFDSAEDAYPAWSPDGKHIAFIRRRAGTRGRHHACFVPRGAWSVNFAKSVSIAGW